MQLFDPRDEELARLAEADVAERDVDDLRPCDRVVELISPDDLDTFYHEFVVDQWPEGEE